MKRLPWGEGNFRQAYQSYKNNAKKESRVFELTREQFREITSQNCYYCNAVPANTYIRTGRKVYGHYLYNGIDRVENEKGYTIENSVPCCSKCNRMKYTYALSEFLTYIKNIYEHLKLGV